MDEVATYQRAVAGTGAPSDVTEDLDDAVARGFAWAMPYVNGIMSDGADLSPTDPASSAAAA